ncbi:hypothetical protein CGRA01v4_04652 [Colletotrichum graminicola]|nr:hypothetical protein CGRA01v4_04652 [Colletotrichum graminicola]
MINFWVALTLFLNANAVASHILRPAPVADIQFDKSARALQDRGLGQGSRKVAQEACGDYNFVFTGLPWNHPAIKASGFTPAQVEASIRADVKAIVNAGYNIKGKSVPYQSLSLYSPLASQPYLSGQRTPWAIYLPS